MTTAIPTKVIFLDDNGNQHATEESAKTANLANKLSDHMLKLLCEKKSRPDSEGYFWNASEVSTTAKLIANKYPTLAWLILDHQVQS